MQEQDFQKNQADYEDYWQRMMSDPLARDKIKILYFLSELREPVSCQLLAELSDQGAQIVEELLAQWNPFLCEVQVEGQPRYACNQSFRDFLSRSEILQAADVTIRGVNVAIADSLCQGGPFGDES